MKESWGKALNYIGYKVLTSQDCRYKIDLILFLPLHRNWRKGRQRVTIAEAKNARWREVSLTDFMSSEYSEVEQLEDEQSQTVFYIKPLPWRHPQVTAFFHQLDTRIEKQKSRRSTDKILPRNTS